MTSESWNDLWSSCQGRKYWTRPEPAVLRLIPGLKEGNATKVLDLGCGIGRHVILLAEKEFNAYAIDSSWEAVSHCRNWLIQSQLSATVGIAEVQALPFSGGFFDCVLSWNVVYHSTRKGMTEALTRISQRIN